MPRSSPLKRSSSASRAWSGILTLGGTKFALSIGLRTKTLSSTLSGIKSTNALAQNLKPEVKENIKIFQQ